MEPVLFCVYFCGVYFEKVVPVNKKNARSAGKKDPPPKKGANFRRAEHSHMCRSPLSSLSASSLLHLLLPEFSSPYTIPSGHHEVSRTATQLIQSIISVFSRLLLDNGLLRASSSAVNVGTALIPSALLVAGVYAVKPEFLAYAVALAGVITSVAFFAGGSSSMSHHIPPDLNLLLTASTPQDPKV